LGSINRRILIQTSSGKNLRPYPQNKANRAGAMTQVVKDLSGKLEAQSSTNSTNNNNNKKNHKHLLLVWF
jgi:hypothetical protein